MKKLLVAVALLGCAFGANAQEDHSTKAGTFSTEIQFNPFSGKDVFTNGGVLSGAYFCTDKFAVIFDLGLNGSNTKDNVEYNDPNDAEKVTSFTTSYQGTFDLSLGFKYFYYNYKRINLYTGAKVSYYHNFAATKDVTKYDPYTNKDVDDYNWDNQGTSNGFGIWAINGINFSVYKGLYLGAELKVGFKDDITTGYTSKTKVNGVETEVKHKAGGHEFNGGFKVNPNFIIGWNF